MFVEASRFGVTFQFTMVIFAIVVRSRRKTGWCGKRMQRNRLESSILKESKRAGMRSAQFNGALDKLAGEIRQAQQTINLPRQLNQHVGAMAVQFGLVQVVGNFEHYRNLGGQGAGTANILAGDTGIVQAVEHSEHAEDTAVSAQ